METTNKTIELSDREKIVKRSFLIATNHGLCSSDDFHSFSRWCKGRSESQIMSHIMSGKEIPKYGHEMHSQTYGRAHRSKASINLVKIS